MTLATMTGMAIMAIHMVGIMWIRRLVSERTADRAMVARNANHFLIRLSGWIR